MDENRFSDQMQELVELHQADQFESSLAHCRRLKAELLADRHCEPLQLGWARFYEFKNLYCLEKYQEAMDLYLAPEPVIFVIPRTNFTWMTSVAAEVAFHLNNPRETLRLSRKALGFRLSEDDLENRFSCALNGCRFLETLESDDLNLEFAEFILHLGAQNHIPAVFLEGVRYLVNHVARSNSPSILAIAQDSRDEIAAIKDTDLQEAVSQVLGHLDHQTQRLQELIQKGFKRGPLELELLRGVRARNLDLVKATLAQGASIFVTELDHEGGKSPLMIATLNNDLEMVKFLLAQGADLHAKEPVQNSTALLFAVNLGFLEVTRELTGRGAGINARGILGQTPLMRAIIEHHRDLVEFLLFQGAFLERRDENGFTALMMAVTEDQPTYADLLVKAGADAAVTNQDGMTLLHLAAAEGKTRVVEWLLALGLDPEAVDAHELRPLDWALQGGHQDVVRLLSLVPAMDQPIN